VYLRDINDYAAFNNVYKEFFSKGPGVRLPDAEFAWRRTTSASDIHRRQATESR
jgi:hypothetical protein